MNNTRIKSLKKKLQTFFSLLQRISDQVNIKYREALYDINKILIPVMSSFIQIVFIEEPNFSNYICY